MEENNYQVFEENPAEGRNDLPELSRRDMWNDAGKAGLVLGGVVLAYTLIVYLLGQLDGKGMMAAAFKSIMSFVVWAAKFGGCILLMRFFMKKLVASYKDVTNADTYRFGKATALLSALICAAIQLVQTFFISKEELMDQMNEVFASLPTSMDANTMAAMESFMDNYQIYVFIGILIYCYLFGWILSAILCRSIPSSNPFDKQ